MDSPAICEVEGVRPVQNDWGIHNHTIFLPASSKNCTKEDTNGYGGEGWREQRRNGKGRQRGRARSVIFLSAVPKNKGCNHSATPLVLQPLDLVAASD
ncbi:MAG: hypothetical protein AUH86_11050 [Acidobacteria bacterium 13_1_40CM_4_58_4]|nr:MAG: hypothetical protein AUH86_11050 [Acidobacteria bacterium 13_1_40CM_4_58_4]